MEGYDTSYFESIFGQSIFLLIIRSVLLTQTGQYQSVIDPRRQVQDHICHS